MTHDNCSLIPEGPAMLTLTILMTAVIAQLTLSPDFLLQMSNKSSFERSIRSEDQSLKRETNTYEASLNCILTKAHLGRLRSLRNPPRLIEGPIFGSWCRAFVPIAISPSATCPWPKYPII